MSTFVTARFDDPQFYLEDPHATFERLRSDDPVHWYAEGEFWVVTKYDDIRFISVKPERFSSERIGIMMDLIAHREGRDPHNYKQRGISFMDPPQHRSHRRAVQIYFTPAEVTKLDARVRDVVSDVFDSLPDGEFDWISHVAEPIPVYIFAHMLGIPEADWPRVATWATIIADAATGTIGGDHLEVIYGEIAPFLIDLIGHRTREPANDLLTMLTQVTVDGVPFDDIQVLNYALVLLAAGSETTQSLLAGLAYCLHLHPRQSERVFADSSLVDNAIEETLRWWTPVMRMARQASCEVEVRGRTVREGDGLLLAYSSANRDTEHFGPSADLFDVTRANAAGHLGFGVGEHFCMGAALARREARLVLDELVRRSAALHVTGELARRSSSLINTFDRLNVTMDRR